MPIIVTQNLKKYIMFNMMELVIEDIDVEGALVNNIWFDMNEFRASFIPAFCSTVYRYKGADINEPYNNYGVNCMDKKQLFTALSRTTKYEYIHLDNQLLNNHYKPRPQPMLERVYSYYNCDYLFGKVYQITFEKCDKVYVTSTTDDLDTRLQQHLTTKNSHVYKSTGSTNPK